MRETENRNNETATKYRYNGTLPLPSYMQKDLFRQAGIKNGDNYTVCTTNGRIIIERVDPKKEWVSAMMAIYTKRHGASVRQGNFTIVTILNNDAKWVNGASCCGKKDNYQNGVGIAVATARALGYQIPDYI